MSKNSECLDSAAPDLLEALEFVLEGHKAKTGVPFDWEAWEVIAKSAIARAKGGKE